MIFTILWTIIFPIFLIILVGFVFDRAFKPDMETLSKLNFYVFVPAIAFISMLDTELAGENLIMIVVFSLAHFFVLFAIAFALFSSRKFREKRAILSLGSVFFNAGNYGIPFVIFAFGASGEGIILLVMIVQIVLTFSFGLWILERETKSWKEIGKGFLKIPVIYAVILGLLLRFLGIDLAPQIKDPLQYIANTVIAFALITLGAKLSRVEIQKNRTGFTISLMRLVVSPLIAVPLVLLFKFTGTTAAILIVSSGLPVAVNTYVLAQEYRRDEDVAAQSILWSTLLSVVTLSILLLFFLGDTILIL
ncbi:MAG: AEC family transporter [Promethearchaeota archaeon]